MNQVAVYAKLQKVSSYWKNVKSNFNDSLVLTGGDISRYV